MATDPTLRASSRSVKLRSMLSINWLLIFAPAAIILDRAGNLPAGFVFFCAAIAIVPFAKLIVKGTEQVAAYAGATLGGLLNATFGNLPELIIAIAALRA
ncbi:MAG: calcium/proton exchanger, partial [Chelatococcus sp.]|nr:calcium/proton exchanger [Chelatococcus sp.]